MLYTYSIMPLDTDHIDEICADVERQYKEGISSCPMFMMYLHPEGNPPRKKAEQQCAKFDLFRERLAAEGIPCGILAQSTIGHGYVLDDPLTFPPYINMTDGAEMTYSCPADEGFLEYFRNAMAILASHHPSAIMIDDDCRLLHRGGRGCACEHHMEMFNRETGEHFNREDLAKHIFSHPDDDPYTQLFIRLQHDTIRRFLQVMREGIDSVDPTIQGINCLTDSTCEIAEDAYNVFSGKGNPVILRIPNGSYVPNSVRGFSRHMMATNFMVAAIKEKADVILAETDTVQYNRYSKSASYLHGHYTASILDGCSGAKHWITRLHSYEPDSGEAFRSILSENYGFYKEIEKIGKEIKWIGACMPFGQKSYRYSNPNFWGTPDSAFAFCVLERMGIPIYFSDKAQNTAFFNGWSAADISDDEIKKIFRGAVFLSEETAKYLTVRGYGSEIGVEVQDYSGDTISGELFDNGNECSVQVDAHRLVPLSERCKVLSVNFHTEKDGSKRELCPAAVKYEKPDGSFTVTYCGTPNAGFNYMEAFAFLNETRKKQFISLLSEAGALDVYADSDGELLMRAGRMPDGALVCAVWNLSWDVYDTLPLVFSRKITRAQRLMPNGEWVAINCIPDKRVEFGIEVKPLSPVVIRVYQD